MIPPTHFTIVWPTHAPDPRIGQILANQNLTLALLRNLSTQVQRMSGTLDTVIAQLVADVTAQSGVIASNTTLLQGISAQLQAALAAAQAAGATAAQLAQLTALDQSIQANTTALVDAAAANPLPTPPAA